MVKQHKTNPYNTVEGCCVHFLFYFLNIHLSAIINADTDSLENASYQPADKSFGF